MPRPTSARPSTSPIQTRFKRSLRMRSDDGFIAYLNGQVIASRNAPGSPQWNSTATAAAPDSQSLVYEDILIPNTPGCCKPGRMCWRFMGWNVSATDLDFFILPELEGLAEGVAVERYFTPPSPGTNNGAGYLGLVADTKFSVDRGFYDTPFTVGITSATATASIYWTTNGSRPSLTNGTLYTAPIPVAGTRLLRRGGVSPQLRAHEPDTHSYIFLNQVLQQSNATRLSHGLAGQLSRRLRHGPVHREPPQLRSHDFQRPAFHPDALARFIARRILECEHRHLSRCHVGT